MHSDTALRGQPLWRPRSLARWPLCHGAVALSLVLQLVGCHSHGRVVFDGPARERYIPFQTEIQIPAADPCEQPDAFAIPAPYTLREPVPDDYWPLSLDEVIRIALENNEVMRQLGAMILQNPTTTATVFDPAIQVTDPLAGEQAALSAFDAEFATSVFWSRDERAFNNIFFGGGARTLHRNEANFRAELRKQSAAGTRFAVRNVTDYDRNNSPVNLFASGYFTAMEVELRHPLLRGSGIQFNRIAGPNAPAGVYNGVLIARTNTDIALADFEIATRDFLNDLQRSYWQLYFAYRNLEARQAGRDAAHETWRTTQAKLEAGTVDQGQEALARDQYFFFQNQVENALAGVPTTALAGGAIGVYEAERQLRRLMGLPAADGRLIRPSDNPSQAETLFDWPESLAQADDRRVELRRQRWTIERQQLELIASRNQLRAQLDMVGLYRWRGFGDMLLGDRNFKNDSAFRDLLSGDLQGWQLGLELVTPIGNRIGHTAVRNAELRLARQRALLREQQRQVASDLSAAFAELARAYVTTRTNFNRSVAARQRLQTAIQRYRADEELLEFVLEAQNRATEADTEYFRSLIDYNLAVAQVHYARGTFLDYLGVYLSEGPWSTAAHRSAADQAQRYTARRWPECVIVPRPSAAGPYPQQVLPDQPVQQQMREAPSEPVPPPEP